MQSKAYFTVRPWIYHCIFAKSCQSFGHKLTFITVIFLTQNFLHSQTLDLSLQSIENAANFTFIAAIYGKFSLSYRQTLYLSV